MSKDSDPKAFWESLFNGEDEVPWTDFREKMKKQQRVAYSSLRGFKAWIAEPKGKSRVVRKDKWISSLTFFPKFLIGSAYQGGGDIVEGVPTIGFIANSFSLPYFVNSTEGQNGILKSGEYCVRFTRGKYLFCIECRDPAGKHSKYGVALGKDSLYLSQTEHASSLDDLIKNYPQFNDLKPHQTSSLCLDKGEEEFFQTLKKEFGNEEKATEEFNQLIRNGIETNEDYKS